MRVYIQRCLTPLSSLLTDNNDNDNDNDKRLGLTAKADQPDHKNTIIQK